MHPTVKAARIAGALYLPIGVMGPFTLIYLPQKLIVRGDAAATAERVLAHESLFRLGIVADMLGATCFVLLVMALYRLLGDVDRGQARLMVALVLVSTAFGLANVGHNIAALQLFRGDDFLGALDKPQRDALGMLFLRVHHQLNFVNELFWGLWLFPFGVLLLRSRFLPRFLGVWLLLNGAAYVALSFIALLAPQRLSVAMNIAMPALLGELVVMLWLVILGARVPEPSPA